jgi:hypothetical protein
MFIEAPYWMQYAPLLAVKCACSEIEHISVVVYDDRIFAVATSLAEVGEPESACAVVLKHSGDHNGVGDSDEEVIACTLILGLLVMEPSHSTLSQCSYLVQDRQHQSFS